MASRTNIRKSANVALIKGKYKDVMDKTLDTLADSKDTLIIDAADIFNDFTLSKYGLSDPIRNSLIFSPITAFQLKRFVDEELSELLAGSGAKTVAILGLKPLFFDPNITDYEYKSLFSSLIYNLKKVTFNIGAELLILTFDEEYNSERNSVLSESLISTADVVFNLNELQVCATC